MLVARPGHPNAAAELHPHAATAYNGWTYSYDANGNMETRTYGGQTYTLGYDSENRLTSVSGAATASFLYDGDGNRVKGTAGGVTTTYIGNHFEWSGSTSTMKRYYYAGGVRIAMRVGSTLSYLFGDHLGSTAITADSSGAKTAEVRYAPWGSDRYTSGTTLTTYRYTGQRFETSFGLYFYNARWYDPSIMRWISPDAIIPDPYNPQDWDRYAFVRNNPVRYTDPTGHWPDWLDNALDYAQGAAYQFANDMTLGAVDKVAVALDLCMDCNRSDAYHQGQQAGRVASTVVSSTEAVLGTAAAAEGLAAMGPTAGGGLLCGAVTAGGCLVVAGVGITAEGAIVLGGTAVAGHGAVTVAYIKGNPIEQHHPWPEYLLGPKKQQLYGLSNKLHYEYHTQLDKILNRQFGKDYYSQMINSPAKLNDLLETIRSFNKYFDKTYGTHTFEALEDVLRTEGFLPK